MIKAVKVLNTISVILFAAIFLLTYAYLPIAVDMNIDGFDTVHKHTFFYYAFSAFLLINIVLRIGCKFGTHSLREDVQTWIHSIIFIINFYLTTLIGFIGVLNNATSISPSNYAYLNYLGPILVAIWIFGLIFLLTKKK